MKFFSFFKQEIHPEVGKKIIPKEQIGQLIEANEIVEIAKKDTEEYTQKVHAECKILKKEAKKEGFDEGLETFNEHIIKLEKITKTLKKELEKKVLPIALKAAKKILGEELKLHPDRIVEIVQQALKPVVQHHKITIYVNIQDLKTLEKEKENIKKMLQQVDILSIQERSDIQPGGCIIETEGGIINAQLENQWRAIESAFEKFMNK